MRSESANHPAVSQLRPGVHGNFHLVTCRHLDPRRHNRHPGGHGLSSSLARQLEPVTPVTPAVPPAGLKKVPRQLQGGPSPTRAEHGGRY